MGRFCPCRCFGKSWIGVGGGAFVLGLSVERIERWIVDARLPVGDNPGGRGMSQVPIRMGNGSCPSYKSVLGDVSYAERH